MAQSKMPDPTTGLAAEDAKSGPFLPEALELMRRAHYESRLSDEEILLLAVTAGQAALCRHWGMDGRAGEHTLDVIAQLLDHDTLVAAVSRRLHLIREPNDGILADRVTTKHTGP
jgi:hypothetical protein